MQDSCKAFKLAKVEGVSFFQVLSFVAIFGQFCTGPGPENSHIAHYETLAHFFTPYAVAFEFREAQDAERNSDGANVTKSKSAPSENATVQLSR